MELNDEMGTIYYRLVVGDNGWKGWVPVPVFIPKEHR